MHAAVRAEPEGVVDEVEIVIAANLASS